ncbi:MAG TPA: DUF6311 domain-containing protein [Candidatus Saccharimonadia bacterium]|nr:DUF6311 domain-containing protein [Candidatus Saccharimonadia bacterium]
MLDPLDVEWLMVGDLAQHFLGWHFFRDEPWRMPPGRIHDYGLEMGSSIVYTDSIPLLALLLKPFASWLPDPLQYAGPWVVTCYALGAAHAWRCGWLATGRVEAAAACAVFAILSPVVALRGHGHFALMAHWLVWWSLGDYLSAKPVARASRIASTCVAALVHAYLLVIVLAIVTADVLRRTLVAREWRVRDAAFLLGGLAVGLSITLWAAGYFVLADTGGGVGQYGRFAAHLGTLWSPVSSSLFLPTIPISPDTAAERAGYLGFGALALIVAAVAATASKPAAWRPLRRHWPLVLATLACTALAITHQVRYGDRLLFELALPPATLDMLSTLRASARLLWLAYYTLVAGAVLALVAWLPRRAAIAVLSIAVALQVLDLAAFHAGLRTHYAAMVAWQAQLARRLDGDFWEQAAARYTHVLVAPMDHAGPHWVTLGRYAADHDMAINVGQFARASWPTFQAAYFRLMHELETGELRRDALYVLARPEAVKLGRLGPDDVAGVVDGLHVVAPGWRAPHPCCAVPAVVAPR